MIFKTLRQATYPVLALPRYAKQVIALSVDITLCILTVWLAFYLRLGEFVAFTQNTPFARGLMSASGVSLLLAIPLFFVSGLYRMIFRYSGWPAMVAVFRALVIYFLLYTSVITVTGIPGVPRTIGLIQPCYFFRSGWFKGTGTLLVGWCLW